MSDDLFEIRGSDLRRWTANEDEKGSWSVKIEHANSAATIRGLPKAVALILVSAPALLEMLVPIAERAQAPLHLDLQRVLTTCGIRLVK